MTLACLAVLLAGCEQQSRVSLIQPQLPGLQRSIELRSEQGYWADDGRSQRVLIEFPLPGAATGRPNYLLYLRMPSGVTTQPAETARGSALSGFLIQTRGEDAGLAALANARIQMVSEKEPREYRVELLFEDDSHVSGSVLATHGEFRVRHFETALHPADVQAAIHRQAATSHK